MAHTHASHLHHHLLRLLTITAGIWGLLNPDPLRTGLPRLVSRLRRDADATSPTNTWF